MNLGIRIVAGLMAIIWAVGMLSADSIWERSRHTSARCSIFSDDKASGRGDVVTIIIMEDSEIETEREREGERSNSSSAKFSGSFDLGDLFSGLGKLGFGKPFQLPNADTSGEYSSSMEGEVEATDENSYEDKVSVVVEEIMPNGNLLILGKRTRMLDGQKQTVQISGIVRPSDISSDNTVNSERVANFNLVYTNRGSNNNYLRSGWFTRIWNLVTPF